MSARIRDSHTGERCECGEGGGHEALTPGDGLCTTCYRNRVDDELERIKADVLGLAQYVDHEDPQAKRVTDAQINTLTDLALAFAERDAA